MGDSNDNGLSTLDLLQKRVVVFGNDVDLFVLLLAHYQNINCTELFMKFLEGHTCITALYKFLGKDAASALLPLLSMHSQGVTSVVNLGGKAKNSGQRSFFRRKTIQNLFRRF